MLKTPLVSVLMSCYNGEKFITSSVGSLISQTYKNWELIFWDNFSTDLTPEIIKSFKDSRIKYYRATKHTKIGIAKNNALKLANGEYVAFCDVDDFWLKKKLELQIKELKKEDVSAVYSKYFIFNEKNSQIKKIIKKKNINYPVGFIFNEVFESFLKSRPLVNNLTTLFRKKEILKLNEIFDENLHVAADFDFILRFSQTRKISFVNKYLAVYRVHSDNETSKNKNNQISELEYWLLKNKNNEKISSNKNFLFLSNNIFYERQKIYAYNRNVHSVVANLSKVDSIIKKIKIILILILPRFIINKYFII